MAKKQYKGDVFAVTFKLNPNPHQKKVLDKKINAYVYIYNKIQTDLRKKFQYCVHLKEWPKRGKKLDNDAKSYEVKYDILSKYCTFEFHNSRTKEVEIRPIFDKKGLEYSFMNYIKEYLKKHSEKNVLKILNKVDVQTIASNICKAWDKTIFKGTKYPKNLNKDDDPSFKLRRVKDIFIGADVSRLKNSEIGLKENTGRKSEFIYIPFEIKENGYEDYAFESRITALSFKRVKVRNKYDYFVIFTFEGEKPKKKTYLGKGIVGIDLGTSDISISSDNFVGKIPLGQEVENIETKIADINVQLDELRRKEYPQNYTEDGQIKRGIKLIWNKSKKHKKLQNKLADLQRKRKINLKISHNKLANFVLTLGNEFKIENNPVSAWTKRANGIRKRSDGKIQSNKRHGKSVKNYAPSMFVTILENKVKSFGGIFDKLPIKNASTRFDFTNGVFTEHKEDERQITLSDGITHDRDIISAFNIQHCLGYTKDDEKKYDVEAMKKHYKHFCEMEFSKTK